MDSCALDFATVTYPRLESPHALERTRMVERQQRHAGLAETLCLEVVLCAVPQLSRDRRLDRMQSDVSQQLSPEGQETENDVSTAETLSASIT